MSENENANVHDQLSQLKRVVGKLRARAQDPATPRWKKAALAAVVSTVLLAGGYEGYRALHAGGPAEVRPTATAVEQARPDELLKTTMRIEGSYVTSGGLLLLNSMKDFRDPANLTIVVPAGHGFTRETRRQVVGKTFTGECTRSSYNGRPQLTATPGNLRSSKASERYREEASSYGPG
jgi:hypothetical protein